MRVPTCGESSYKRDLYKCETRSGDRLFVKRKPEIRFLKKYCFLFVDVNKRGKGCSFVVCKIESTFCWAEASVVRCQAPSQEQWPDVSRALPATESSKPGSSVRSCSGRVDGPDCAFKCFKDCKEQKSGSKEYFQPKRTTRKLSEYEKCHNHSVACTRYEE